MVDFRYLINDGNSKESATTKEISLQTTFLCVGGFVGGLSKFKLNFFNYIYKKIILVSFIYKSSRLSKFVNRQLVTALLLLAYGVSNACVPQLKHIALLYGAIFITGLGGGNWMAVTITWMIELWSVDWPRLFPALLQAFQLVYGIGTIIGPLVAKPFLYGYMNETEVEKINVTEYLEKVEIRRSSLAVPYAISGSLHAFGKQKIF